jgi:hypothetical protein
MFAKRNFYRHNIVVEDAGQNDIGIYDADTRTIVPLSQSSAHGGRTAPQIVECRADVQLRNLRRAGTASAGSVGVEQRVNALRQTDSPNRNKGKGDDLGHHRSHPQGSEQQHKTDTDPHPITGDNSLEGPMCAVEPPPPPMRWADGIPPNTTNRARANSAITIGVGGI